MWLPKGRGFIRAQRTASIRWLMRFAALTTSYELAERVIATDGLLAWVRAQMTEEGRSIQQDGGTGPSNRGVPSYPLREVDMP